MYLALSDLADLFKDIRGAQDDGFLFHSVADHASAVQPKGLFIPLNEQSGELSEAITNGAIAALWDGEKKLPRYTPNNFPILFTNDPAEAVHEIMKRYIEKLDGEANCKMEITNFKFSNKKLLNKNKQTYDIAGILEKLMNKNTNNTERRG